MVQEFTSSIPGKIDVDRESVDVCVQWAENYMNSAENLRRHLCRFDELRN